MYALRILTGPQAGEIFKLESGVQVVGRSEECKIRLNSNSVSKEHAEIEVGHNMVIIRDKQSRNGTFVNGVQTRTQHLRFGDKIAFHDIIADIVPTAKLLAKPTPPNSQENRNVQMPEPSASMGASSVSLLTFQEKLEDYVQRVVLPPFFELMKKVEFRLVIAGMLFAFAVLLTIISLFPMSQIIEESIEKESRARALTIARSLQSVNAPVILSGSDANLTTQTADLEDSVSESFIISQIDGAVLAPAAQAGSVPEYPFIEKVRREQKELVERIENNQIGAAVPIAGLNPQTGEAVIKAYAVVIYDMGGLALDEKRTLALFIQTLMISLILGFIFYSILVRLLDVPIIKLNRVIDEALKGNHSDAKVDIQHFAIQDLVTNINTLLSRIQRPDLHAGPESKTVEAQNIIYLMSNAALAISPSLEVLAVNNSFEKLLGIAGATLLNRSISHLSNENLKNSILAVIDSARVEGTLVETQSQFHENLITISCQMVSDQSGPCYFVIKVVNNLSAIGSAS